ALEEIAKLLLPPGLLGALTWSSWRGAATMAEGIRVRHARSCPKASDHDAKCSCKPAYEASVWDRRTNTKRRKTFPTQAAAKSWRADTMNAKNRGKLAAQSRETVKEAGTRWLQQAKAGEVRKADGQRY